MKYHTKTKPSGIGITRQNRNIRNDINAINHTNPQTNRYDNIPTGIPGWPRLLTEELASAYLSLPLATFNEGIDAGSFPAPIVIAEERLWDRVVLDRAIDALSWAETQRPRIEKQETRTERTAERQPASPRNASVAGGEEAPSAPAALPIVSAPAAVPPPPPLAPPERPRQLRRAQASAYLRTVHNLPCTRKLLARLAMIGAGPVFDRVGGVSFYRHEHLDAWAAEKRAELRSAGEQPPATPPPTSREWPARMYREEASAYLLEAHGISRTVATLAKLATVGGGPTFQKDGRFPLYRREDLDAWAAARLSAPVRSTAELPPRPSDGKQS